MGRCWVLALLPARRYRDGWVPCLFACVVYRWTLLYLLRAVVVAARQRAMLQKNHDLAPAADPKARAIFLQNALVPHHERLANGNNQSI